jgi:hypothetical protein
MNKFCENLQDQREIFIVSRRPRRFSQKRPTFKPLILSIKLSCLFTYQLPIINYQSVVFLSGTDYLQFEKLS